MAITVRGGIPFTEVRIKPKAAKAGKLVDFGKGKKRQVQLRGTKGTPDSVRIGDVTVFPSLLKPQTYAEQGRTTEHQPELVQKEKDKFELWKNSKEKWYEVPMISIVGDKAVNERPQIDFYIKDGIMEEKDSEKVQEYLKSDEYKEILSTYFPKPK